MSLRMEITMTEVVKIPLTDPQLDTNIRQLCDAKWAGLKRLAATFVAANHLILIFQPK